MKSPKTLRRDGYKRELHKLVKENPEAQSVNMRYKVMRWLLDKQWKTLMSHGVNDSFLKDVVYIDRMIRKFTEGKDVEKKKILSQEYQIKELGYESSALTEDFKKTLERN